MQFVDEPEHTAHLHCASCRAGAKRLVAGEQHASLVLLGQCEGEAMMDRDARSLPADLYRACDAVAAKVDYLQPGTEERALLRGGEPQQPIPKERVGDQQFVRQPHKRVEEGRLAEIDQAATVTDINTQRA
ncbi:MAG: hypothetical protein ACK5UM_01220 [Pseudomonadota bacterium]|nr:hypothetical protein [Rubrivivax sp.]MCA3259554.1 hypothetical protein [Rubrivivax sp.]MCE2912086.1 hypothetical protein [Rubrivivax sp.]MCZ8030758.1 hypothetical protein [Rubrivivax sp.]